MTWIVRIPDGPEVDSDVLTLDDLDKIEKASGTPWSTMNPLREAKVARVFLKVLYEHVDRDPAEVDELTMRQLKSMFDFKPDEEGTAEPARPTKARKGQTPRSSSDGAATGSAGRRASQEPNASVTSLIS